MRNYKNIKAFQLADDLAIEVYKVTRHFPKEELYGLTSQLRRAGVSVPATLLKEQAENIRKITCIFYLLPEHRLQKLNIFCIYQKDCIIWKMNHI